MSIVKVSAKGSIVIPAEIRKKYGITSSSLVEINDVAGFIQLIPIPDDPVKAGRGMFHSDQSVSDMIKENRKRDVEREKRLLEIGLGK